MSKKWITYFEFSNRSTGERAVATSVNGELIARYNKDNLVQDLYCLGNFYVLAIYDLEEIKEILHFKSLGAIEVQNLTKIALPLN